MEGLIMYLTLPAIDAMLSFIVKNSGPGSAILFDCSGKTGSHDSMTRKKLEDHTAQSGEPIRFSFPEEGAEAFLVQRGFSQVRP